MKWYLRNQKEVVKWVLAGLTVLVMACDKQDDEGTQITPEPKAKIISVDLETIHQTIAGFGGANQMWGTQFLTPSQVKTAFDNEDTDLGLSIFRVRIASNQNEWQHIVEVCQEAQKYGAKILASPWSPPLAFKSNGAEIGGHLLKEHYEDYALYINSFVQFMAGNGVDIYAVSIQNEPDIKVSYESCDWTPAAMLDFIKNFGHLIEGAKIAAPESFNFNQVFSNVLLNDDGAAANFDIVAGHIYGNGLAPYPLAEEKGKEIWMTEYLLNQDATSGWSELAEDVIWDETLTMLNTIHESMLNNWNAYIWWYLKRYYSFLGDGEQGTTTGEVLKRGYAFSQFSKFIRPGYVRVDVQDEAKTGLEISAYKGDGKVVVVLINPGEHQVSYGRIVVPDVSVSSAIAYTTNLNFNRQEKELELEQEEVLVNIPPKSVMTVVIALSD